MHTLESLHFREQFGLQCLLRAVSALCSFSERSSSSKRSCNSRTERSCAAPWCRSGSSPLSLRSPLPQRGHRTWHTRTWSHHLTMVVTTAPLPCAGEGLIESNCWVTATCPVRVLFSWAIHAECASTLKVTVGRRCTCPSRCNTQAESKIDMSTADNKFRLKEDGQQKDDKLSVQLKKHETNSGDWVSLFMSWPTWNLHIFQKKIYFLRVKTKGFKKKKEK